LTRRPIATAQPKEDAVITNTESFVALGGHAAATARAARHLAARREEHGATARADQAQAVAPAPSWGRRLLGRTGDLMIAIGARMKAQSGHTSPQTR